jgi:hypothetical protein
MLKKMGKLENIGAKKPLQGAQRPCTGSKIR